MACVIVLRFLLVKKIGVNQDRTCTSSRQWPVELDGAILDLETIESIVLETRVFCLSRLLIGYWSFKRAFLGKTAIEFHCLGPGTKF